MKRFIYSLLIFSFAFSSCEKYLDTVPTGQLTPINSYKSDAQINAVMAGIHQALKYHLSYSQYYTVYHTAPNDDTYFANNNTSYANFNYSATDATPGNPSETIWRYSWVSINYCNSLLDNIDESNANGGTLTEDAVRRAKGEALFMRGFYYSLLAQWYGDVPLLLHATSDPKEGQVVRTPVKKVYDQIIADMTTADSLLYDVTFATRGYTERATREAVQGMLARVCLYAAGEPVNDTKRYEDALYWAKKVVNSGRNSLLPSYSQVFIDAIQNRYNNESMFEAGFIQNGAGEVSSGGGIGYWNGVPQGSTDSGRARGDLRVHPRLYFKYEPGDYRRDWNISNYSYSNNFASTKVNVSGNVINGALSFPAVAQAQKLPIANNRFWNRYPAKWRRDTYESLISRVSTSTSTNFPILRYSDVLLMLAEAEFKVNGATQLAFDAINQVRRRSISNTPIVDSISTVVDGINTGTGYNYAPDSISYTNGGGSGFGFQVVYSPTSKTVQVLLEDQGRGFTSAPTITIGRQWRPGVQLNAGTQVAAPNGRLYTATTAGTTTDVAPTHTSGSSSAATTGPVFAYAGYACKPTVYISPQPVVDLDESILSAKGFTFMDAVMDERSRELCFEALRLHDLKRWGILVPTIKSLALDVEGNNPFFPRINSWAVEFGATSAPVPMEYINRVSMRDMLLPIPQRDLFLNFKLTQNPGY